MYEVDKAHACVFCSLFVLVHSHLPPCSVSESVRCVREKLAMLAGEMEKRE